MTKRASNIWIGLNRTVNTVSRAIALELKEAGLTTGQFAVLEALYHKGEMSIGQVQEKILTTSGNIPVIVKNLERDNLLSTHKDLNDRRRTLLNLTSKGEELIAEVFPRIEKIIVSYVNRWDRNEQIQLEKILKKFGGIK